MVIGTSCIILCTVRMVTVVEEAPAGQFFLKRNEIKRQPYYGGGGLADFSLASRAPKVHDENENRTRKRATKTTTNKHKTCITVH